MITLLNPHRPALSSISPNRKRQTVPIPQLQLYTPAGNKLDITPDADPDPNHHDLENSNFDVNVNAEGDGGRNPLIPQIRVREPTPHVVCCEGRYHIWSMDDWLPMPPEMDLGRDSILNYKIVRKLPQQGPHTEVFPRTTVSEAAPAVALAPVTIPAPIPSQSDPNEPQSIPEPVIPPVELEPSDATADDCPLTPPMDIEEGDSRETDMVLDTPPTISAQSVELQLRSIDHDTAPASHPASPLAGFVIDTDKGVIQEDCAIEVKIERLADYAEQQLELQHSSHGRLPECAPAPTQTEEEDIEIGGPQSQQFTGSLYLNLGGYGSQNTTTEEDISATTSTDTSESLVSIPTPSQPSISPASPAKDGDRDGDCELHTMPSCSVLPTAGPVESRDKPNLDIPVTVMQSHSTTTSPTIWQKGPRVNPANRSQAYPIPFVIPTSIKKLELPCQSGPKRVIKESDHVRAPSETQVITGTDSFTSEIGASLPMLTPATSQLGLYIAQHPQNGSPGFTSRHMNAIDSKLDDKCGPHDKTWPKSHNQAVTKPQAAQRARHTMALSTILQAEPFPVTHSPSYWRASSSVRPDTAPVAPATPTIGPKSVMSGNPPQTMSASSSILTPIDSADDQEVPFTPVSRTGPGIVPVSSPVDTVCEANSTPTPARTLAAPKMAKATVKQLKALKTPMVIINEGRARAKTIKPANKRQATSMKHENAELESPKKRIKTTQPKPRSKTVAASKKHHQSSSSGMAGDQEEDLVGPRSRAPALEPLADLTGLSTEAAETICARATKSVENAQATHGIHRLAYTVEELKAIHGFLGPDIEQWVVGKNSMDALKDHLIKAGFSNSRTPGALRCKVRDWRNTMMAPPEPEAQE